MKRKYLLFSFLLLVIGYLPLASAAIAIAENPFSLATNPTLLVCDPPENIEVEVTAHNAVTVNWQPSGTEEAWEVQYGDVGLDPDLDQGTIVSTSTNVDFEISNLTENTTYELYVRGVCNGETEFSSWVGPVESTTECSPFELDYSEDFNSFFPDCWQQAGHGTPDSGPEELGQSDWISDDFMDLGGSGAARLHLNSNVDQEWLISPGVQLSTDELIEVSLDFGVKEFLGEASSLGSDDEVQLLIKVDGESEWSTLATWDQSFVSPSNGEAFTFDITDYNESTVQFAIWATDGTVNDPENNKVFIDNFLVEEVPTCPGPVNIDAPVVEAYSATVNWEAGGTETLWNAQIGIPGFDPTEDEGVLLEVEDTPEVLFENLSPGSSYQVYIQSICIPGEDYSTWIGPFTFTTPCGVDFPVYTEDFTTYVPNCWLKAGNGLPEEGPSQIGVGGWVSDFFMENTNTDAAKLTLNSNTSQEWLISTNIQLEAGVDYQLDFDLGILDVSTEMPASLGSDDEFQVLYSTDDGDTWQVLSVIDNSYLTQPGGEMVEYMLDGLSGETLRFAFWGSDGDVIDSPAKAVYVDNFRIREIPSCHEPSNLSFNNVSITTVNLSWDAEDDESQWTVKYGPPGFDPNSGVGDEVTAFTNQNFQLSGLGISTNYDVYVRADCVPGEDSSLWIGPVSFETLCQTFPVTDFPWLEDFDDEIAPVIPCGWWTENTNGDAHSWQTNSIYGNSDPNALYIRWNDTEQMDDWAFTPELVLSAEQTYTLTFGYKASGVNFSENLSVFLCEDDDSESLITELIDIEGFSNNNYETAEVTFTVDQDGSYHLGFHGYSPPDQFYIAVDDVQICDIQPHDDMSDPKTASDFPFSDSGELNVCHSDNFGADGRDIFYSFNTPVCADSVTISLCNSDFDTRLSLLDAAGNELATNDNATGCGDQSLIANFPVLPGEDYLVVVEGVGEETGQYEIEIEFHETYADPSFSYASSIYCVDEEFTIPEVTGQAGGEFSATDGLVIDSTTGEIDLEASGEGQYTVTYSTGNDACDSSAETEIVIYGMPTAEFTYSIDTLCTYHDAVLPMVTGDEGGDFFADDGGLAIDPETGEIDPANSEVGVYEITYEVSVNDCESSASQIIVIDPCTGVGEFERDVKLVFYPNPADDFVFVNLSELEGSYTFELLDLTGKVAVHKILSAGKEQAVEVSSLESGIYLIRISADEMNIIKKMLINR